MSSDLQLLKSELLNLANPQKAKILQKFFKTGRGEYAEGDIFLGITVPQQRKVAKKFVNLKLSDCSKLLNSKYHEERLVALLIIKDQFKKADNINKKKLCRFYLKHYQFINNWDLVDLTAYDIVGYCSFHFKQPDLKLLANKKSLWLKRIAIVSTFYHLRQGVNSLTFKIAEKLLKDKHDLIHKAIGWMLRESGKRVSVLDLEDFLWKHIEIMPRTTLRYAIERFSENQRKKFLNYKINKNEDKSITTSTQH